MLSMVSCDCTTITGEGGQGPATREAMLQKEAEIQKCHKTAFFVNMMKIQKEKNFNLDLYIINLLLVCCNKFK